MTTLVDTTNLHSRKNLCESAQIAKSVNSQRQSTQFDSSRSYATGEMGYDYTGISFQEKTAAQGVPASVTFGLSLMVEFAELESERGRPLIEAALTGRGCDRAPF